MAKSTNNKSTSKDVNVLDSETTEISEGVYTLANGKLSQESELQAITELDGIIYYWGVPNAEIDDATPSERTKSELEALISEARQLKIAELNATCDSLLVSFKSSATGVERIYDSEVEDQLNILALVAAGVDSYFRCALPGGAKENVKHTAQQMKQVFGDGLKYKSVIIGICGILKAYVETQSSIDKIRRINWLWFNTETQTITDPLDIANAENTSIEE